MTRARAGFSDHGTSLDGAVQSVRRAEWVDGSWVDSDDFLVQEEPLGIRIAGASVAVVMRTPGHDEELVRGFLLTERIVAHRDEVRSIRPCDVGDFPDAEGNVIRVTLGPEVDFDLARFRRNMFASSSCGVCGKASIEQAIEVAGPFPEAPRWSMPKRMFTIHELPDLSLPQGRFWLTTIRGHDQFNTTVYDLNDRYRGIFGHRHVVLMAPDDLERLGLQSRQRVRLRSFFRGTQRQLEGFSVVPYDIPSGNVACYFSEANPLVSAESFADGSRTPTSKRFEASIEPLT